MESQAADKYVFITDDLVAFIYCYSRPNDRYVCIDISYRQQVHLFNSKDSADRKYDSLNESYIRQSIDTLPLQNLIVDDGYLEVAMCMN